MSSKGRSSGKEGGAPGIARRAANGRRRCANILFFLGLAAAVPAKAQDRPQADLAEMKLEDLLSVKVTSVSKKDEKLSRTAAAVYVIDQDDIRRSGATNIPDLLRMAPGVDVEQVDANAWAISIRGFNSRYSNKVLVLIDGRTVYTPSFSGVYWEQIDMPLEDIDRIEVIRGPGATVWGANAVNGVINILTKSSKDTKGGLVTVASGSQLAAEGLMQYGGSVGQDASYRGFVKAFEVNSSAMADGSKADDHWMRGQAGFRTDWDITKNDSLMVEGGMFGNEANQTLRSSFIPTPFDRFSNADYDATGGDVMARWQHTLAGGSQTSVQTSFDTYRRTDLAVPEVLRTFDFDFQDHMTAGARQDIVWGGGYRVYDSSLSPGYSIGFSPPSQKDSLFNAFFQDEIRLGRSLWLTVGCKLEHNSFTGFNTEPSARLLWSPAGGRHTLWASASQAVRQPSRQDTAIQTVVETVPLGPNALQVLQLSGNPKIQNEEARDFELGYRAELTNRLSLDIATFLTFYHHLETAEPLPLQVIPGSTVEYLVPMTYENKAHAVDYGGEVFLNWKATSRWRISPGYSYLHATLWQDTSSQGLASFGLATSFPQNMVQVRSQLNLSSKVHFDQSLYYTARLPGGSIPGHARLDLRLARRIGESAEISLVGQNLLRPRTMEYGDSYSVVGTQSLRSVYGSVTWRF